MSGKPTVLIEVRGGVADVTHEPKGVRTIIVDWDSTESGECPLCRGDLPPDWWEYKGFEDDMHPECFAEYEDILNE
jgi:hypothetical protein